MKKLSHVPNDTLKRWKNSTTQAKLDWLGHALEFVQMVHGKNWKKALRKEEKK